MIPDTIKKKLISISAINYFYRQNISNKHNECFNLSKIIKYNINVKPLNLNFILDFIVINKY